MRTPVERNRVIRVIFFSLRNPCSSIIFNETYVRNKLNVIFFKIKQSRNHSTKHERFYEDFSSHYTLKKSHFL